MRCPQTNISNTTTPLETEEQEDSMLVVICIMYALGTFVVLVNMLVVHVVHSTR
jgi:hypothetical protein